MHFSPWRIQESERKFYDPTSVLHSLSTGPGAPLDVRQQVDVSEFLNLVMERLENELLIAVGRVCGLLVRRLT